MKNFMIAIATASTALATPAMANSFTGVRAEVTAGVDDVTGPVAARRLDLTDVTYGAAVGFDAELYKNVIVGFEANLDNGDVVYRMKAKDISYVEVEE